MARIGIVFGLLLFGLTIAGLSTTTQKTYTQFIPMMFGIPLLFLGVVALNPHRRRESVFVALLLALLCTVLGSGRLISLFFAWMSGGHINPLSLRLVAGMTLIGAVFVIVAERWRRARPARGTTPASNDRTSVSIESAKSAAEAVDQSATVTRARTDHENPYQSPTILDASGPTSPSTPATTSKLTDHTPK